MLVEASRGHSTAPSAEAADLSVLAGGDDTSERQAKAA